MPASSSSVSAPDNRSILAAARVLADGGLVVYPTETLYGLGADALNTAALQRLVELKGRELGKPISVLISDMIMLRDLVEEIPANAARLMRAFWPGPLTLVLRARAELSPVLTGGGNGIGVRLSSHALATSVVRALGRPITTPSANPAGLRPPISVDEARAYFGARVDYYLDGGRLHGKPPSTVVDMREDLKVIRAGAITQVELRAALRATV